MNIVYMSVVTNMATVAKILTTVYAISLT